MTGDADGLMPHGSPETISPRPDPTDGKASSAFDGENAGTEVNLRVPRYPSRRVFALT